MKRPILPTHKRTTQADVVPQSMLRPGETEEQAYQRRLRESEQVDERVIDVDSIEEFDAQLREAGDKLVVLEMQSDYVCQTGFDEEPEIHWKDEEGLQMSHCRQVKHVFVRTARACPDVVFLQAVADTEGGEVICKELGINVLPTVQFWKEGQLLWEHKGYASMEPGIGEGVLYYGDTAGGGVKASDFVSEIESVSQYQRFVTNQKPNVLTVLYVGLQSAQPCITIYPAVLALAKNFVGHAVFARLIGDASPELGKLITDLKVLEVPTFIFYRNGKEVGRHVGSSRADLIGQILKQQAAAGIAPPPPPPKVKQAPQPQPMRQARSAWR